MDRIQYAFGLSLVDGWMAVGLKDNIMNVIVKFNLNYY